MQVGRVALLAVLLSAGLHVAEAGVQAAVQAGAGDSYYEFGTVVAVGRRDIEVQSFDPGRGRTVQKTFTFGKDTRADVVRVGDAVEVIYSPGAADGGGGQWVLRRLLMLASGVPKAGPAPSTGSVAVARNGTGDAGAPVPVVPGKKSVGLGKAAPSSAPLARAAGGSPSLGKNGSTRTAAPAEGAAPMVLGNAATARTPGVVAVPLGVSSEIVNGVAPKVKNVGQLTPEEACHRSDAEWPTAPIKLAVLDFRYPTDREEAHNVGKTGGGSGTAVADLVYDALDGTPDFALMRGDRQKLYRADFAGAARAGRELGADAVILGTFNPVQAPVTDPDFPPPVEGYSLRAGVVDTCTGQLLYRLTSISCPSATVGAEGDPRACPGSTVSMKVAPDPIENRSAYVTPIGTLLAPLEGKAKVEQDGALGVVTAGGSNAVSIRLHAGSRVKVDEEVAVHATRLAKNPTTYTLHRYQDEEIGRLIVRKVSGDTASGTYAGDVVPRVGDSVFTVSP